MFKKLYKHLENRGFSVYSVGQRAGYCQSPYVVIKERGAQPFLSSLATKAVDIAAYYPLGNYSEFEAYVAGLREALADLREMRYTQVMTPAVIDTQMRAYTTSMAYQIIMKRSV